MLAHLGAMLAYLEGNVGPSWGYVGPSWGYVGPSWGYVGPSCGLCWPMLTHLKPQDPKNGEDPPANSSYRVGGHKHYTEASILVRLTLR